MKLLNNFKEKNGFLPIGKITGVHGIKGDIKVYSYAESLTGFKSYFKKDEQILLKDSNGFEKYFTVSRVKPHQQKILLSLEEVKNRNQAEMLAGMEIFIPMARLPVLGIGTYYWFELIGLDVFTTDNKCIGQIESVIPTGSNDVYVVKHSEGDNEMETLIPALKSVVLSVDLTQKKMTVDIPEGL